MSEVRLSVLGLDDGEITGIVDYFREMGVDTLYMEEDSLVIGLDEGTRKRMELLVFMSDLELLVGSKLKVNFDSRNNMDMSRLLYM